MTWWQIALVVYFLGGIVVFVGVHWAGSNEPTDHGQIIIGQFAFIGCFLWPFILLWLPFAGLWALFIWLFGKET